MSGSAMEWTKVRIETDGVSVSGNHDFDDLGAGLETNAESMHHEFLKTLPHLSEVREGHNEVVSDIESRALGTSISTMGEFLSEFGGEWEDSEIRLPLPSAIREDLALDTKEVDGCQVVRILSPERFGGIIRSFSLPEGRRVNSASWEGDILSMKVD